MKKLSYLIAVAVMFFGLIGCGGGGGGNHAPVALDDNASTTRGGAAVDIDALANDTDSDGDTLTLQSVATPAHGTATISSGKIHYTPPSNFSGTVMFEYTVSDGTVTDTATVTVTIDKSWGNEAMIESGTEDAYDSQIAFDGDGNAIAVWEQYDGAHWSIYANRYTPGGGWGTATVIESGTGSAGSPKIAIDADGNAIAVWAQYDGAHNSIYANRYTPGGGWGTETVIESGTDNAGSPQIAIDGDGNAIAVWHQNDGANLSIYANRYTAGGGWGTTATVIESGTGTAVSPQIAIDGDGNAIAVWQQYDGSHWNIYANRYTPSGGWGTTATVIESGTGTAYDPQIAIDGDGNAIAVWYQYDGGHLSIYANRYTSGGGWDMTATVIESGTGDAYDPQIAIDGDGNAIVVWVQDDGSYDSIYANRYTSGGGWGSATLIESGTGDAYDSQIAIDGDGNAIAVWDQDDGVQWSTYANRYTFGGGWGTATVIESSTSDAYEPQIAIDGDGNAIAVWVQDDGSYENIYANRFY
jgi:hypothetical protein